MLSVSNLTFRIAGRTLFSGAGVSIPDGAKAGLVGQNGTGKTTLFNLISGELSPESGAVSVRNGARMGRVTQEAPGGPQSLLDFVLAADTERMSLLAEAESASDPDRIAAIYERLTDIDAYSAEARAGAILSGLGFDKEAQQRPCSAFSGGWRMRVALAAVLFLEPDLLLLDEPTNYLDLEGTVWLENYIRRYRHTVLLISHDRDLLNNTVNTIVHLSEQKLTLYRGGYDQFRRQRAERARLMEKEQAKTEARRKHLQSFVDRFRAKASKAVQAQSRVKMLEKLADSSLIRDESVSPIKFPQPQKKLSPPIISLEGAAVGYEPLKPVLKNLSLRIDHDDRIALLGQNGNGKSTFIKLLANVLKPESGDLTRVSKLTHAYFAQHQLDELRPEETAVDHVRAHIPGKNDAGVRAVVAGFGLATHKMDTPAKDLSGGEKARLLLGLATLDGPDLIMLDEPTNHLDVEGRESLIEAINDYQGAVILVSHDRHLVDLCADRLWLVEGGTVQPFDGDMNDYRKRVLSARSTGNGKPEVKPETADPEKSAQDRRRDAARKREEQAPLRKKLKSLEQDIGKLQKEIEKIDAKLSDGTLFSSEPSKAAEFSKRRSDNEEKIAALEEEWLEISEALEG